MKLSAVVDNIDMVTKKDYPSISIESCDDKTIFGEAIVLVRLGGHDIVPGTVLKFKAFDLIRAIKACS